MVGYRFFRFTVAFVLCILLLLTVALKDRHYAVRLLTPLLHCLGCFVGIIFGLHFNRLGINAVSGCLLGIVSAALIVQSMSKLHYKDYAPWVMIVALVCLVMLMVYLYCVIFLMTHVHFAPLYWLKRMKWLNSFNLVLTFGLMIGAFASGNNFLAFRCMNSVISIFYATTVLGNSRFAAYSTLWTYVVTFIGMLQYAIANKHYSLAYYVGSALVSCTFFGVVGWYYYGLLVMPGYVSMGFSVSTLFVVDEELAKSWQHGAGAMVLYVTCSLLGAGICGLIVYPLLLPFLELCKGWLEKMFRSFFLFYVQSVCQFIAPEFGVQGDTVYEVLKGHVFGLGFSLRYAVMVSGTFLGGLCGRAMVMLINSSNDERITGSSFMLFSSVLGALTASYTLGLKVGIPIGALLGCSTIAGTLLWKHGYNFKAYFQKIIQRNLVPRIGFIGLLGWNIKKWIYI